MEDSPLTIMLLIGCTAIILIWDTQLSKALAEHITEHIDSKTKIQSQKCITVDNIKYCTERN